MTNTAAVQTLDEFLDKLVDRQPLSSAPRPPECDAALWVHQHSPRPRPEPGFANALRSTLLAGEPLTIVASDTQAVTPARIPVTRTSPARSRWRTASELAAVLALLVATLGILISSKQSQSPESPGQRAAGDGNGSPAPQLVAFATATRIATATVVWEVFPEPTFAAGTTLQTTAAMTLRSRPGFDAPAIGTIPMGDTVLVLETATAGESQVAWIRIDSGATRQVGWLPRAWLMDVLPAASPAPGDGPFQPGDLAITTHSVNLRAAPSTESEVLESLEPGVGLIVVGPRREADGYFWIAVRVPSSGNIAGYVADEFILLERSDSSRTDSADPLPYSRGDRVITSNRTNLRTTASTESDILAIVEPGTELEVIESGIPAEDYVWLLVRDPDTGQYGFLPDEFVEPPVGFEVSTPSPTSSPP